MSDIQTLAVQAHLIDVFPLVSFMGERLNFFTKNIFFNCLFYIRPSDFCKCKQTVFIYSLLESVQDELPSFFIYFLVACFTSDHQTLHGQTVLSFMHSHFKKCFGQKVKIACFTSDHQTLQSV